MPTPAQPSPIAPAPVPTVILVERAVADDGTAWVRLQVATPVGIAVYHLPAAEAGPLADAIRAAGDGGPVLHRAPPGFDVGRLPGPHSNGA